MHCCLSLVSIDFSLTFATRTAVPFSSATGKQVCYFYPPQPTLKRRSQIHSPQSLNTQLTQKWWLRPYLSSHTEQERFKFCGYFNVKLEYNEEFEADIAWIKMEYNLIAFASETNLVPTNYYKFNPSFGYWWTANPGHLLSFCSLLLKHNRACQ